MPSSHSAPLLLLPQNLYSTVLGIDLGFFAVFAQLTVSLTVGKPFSSPLVAFFLIPAHCNSSYTVIIIFSHIQASLSLRGKALFIRGCTQTHTELNCEKKIALNIHTKGREGFVWE